LRFKPDQMNWDGSNHYEPIKQPYRKCFWPWLSMTVDADGSVYPCGCQFAVNGWKPYGNLREQSLEEIWNGERYVETRRFLSGECGKKAGLDLPCYTCPFFGDPAVEKAAPASTPAPVILPVLPSRCGDRPDAPAADVGASTPAR